MTSTIIFLTLVLASPDAGACDAPARATEPMVLKDAGRNRFAQFCPLLRRSEPRLRSGRPEEALDETDDTRDVELIGMELAWVPIPRHSACEARPAVSRSFRPLIDRSPILRC
ncbi:hypothetical protein TA3x_004956 [Tundrisphaera sp. TA3]|uniref:hypothetical protein n=1 Tax=Tundrisphaera sp. TA3 TaxID=3435775 RepID=UPI003EB8D35C